MSTVIVAAILIIFVAGICLLLALVNNKQKRKALHYRLQQFSKEGTKHNLSFSSQEILENCTIGLDGIQRKLLVMQQNDAAFHSFLINLDEVKACSVKRLYGTINDADTKAKSAEQFLEKIVLHFAFTNGQAAVQVPFYEHLTNNVYEVSTLEAKAKRWEEILSRMVAPMKQRA